MYINHCYDPLSALQAISHIYPVHPLTHLLPTEEYSTQTVSVTFPNPQVRKYSPPPLLIPQFPDSPLIALLLGCQPHTVIQPVVTGQWGFYYSIRK